MNDCDNYPKDANGDSNNCAYRLHALLNDNDDSDLISNGKNNLMTSNFDANLISFGEDANEDSSLIAKRQMDCESGNSTIWDTNKIVDDFNNGYLEKENCPSFVAEEMEDNDQERLI